MAQTVNSAFSQFMTECVDLDQGEVKTARSSRNWLIDKINAFSDKYQDFPEMYVERHMGFGSFARSTKKRDLDDIDLLFCIKAQGATYNEAWDGRVTLEVPSSANVLRTMTKNDGVTLNSIRVINRFVKYLDDIPQYEKADKKRNQEAATLKLSSYAWNFDIVPCFFTTEESNGRRYFLIPDGNGDWKKTDPRLDKEKTTRINTQNNGHVLQVIRIMKYWNSRRTMPSMGSYLLENIVLNYYENNVAGQWVDLEFLKILKYIRDSIFSSVMDPKDIEGDLNQLTIGEKQAIFDRATLDIGRAEIAVDNERDNPSLAINKWREIFGANFPTYG